MKQKKFNFEIDPQYSLENYVISPHNQAAFEWLFNISYWKKDPTVKGCLLVAEHACGKTHLSSIIASLSEDVVIYH